MDILLYILLATRYIIILSKSLFLSNFLLDISISTRALAIQKNLEFWSSCAPILFLERRSCWFSRITHCATIALKFSFRSCAQADNLESRSYCAPFALQLSFRNCALAYNPKSRSKLFSVLRSRFSKISAPISAPVPFMELSSECAPHFSELRSRFSKIGAPICAPVPFMELSSECAPHLSELRSRFSKINAPICAPVPFTELCSKCAPSFIFRSCAPVSRNAAPMQCSVLISLFIMI